MDVAGFPSQFARTRRFSLGAPQRFTVSPDGARVLFLRTRSGSDARTLLWVYSGGAERLLAGGQDPPDVLGYGVDLQARTVAFTANGQLWMVDTDGGAPRRLPAAEPASDCCPSPDGSLVAYVSRGALRVTRADGTDDRALAEPEGPEVTYGLTGQTLLDSERGYWWSPTGDELLVARVDASMVKCRYVADPADPGRAPRVVRYPQAGTAVAETSLQVVSVTGGRVPVRLPAQAPADSWDPAFTYLVTAGWFSAGPVASVLTRDQQTTWTLRIDPASGTVAPLSKLSASTWTSLVPGTPVFTSSGVPVLTRTDDDVPSISIGGVSSPPGLYVHAVLGLSRERVLFTASTEPTEVHVWSYAPSGGFEPVTSSPGVHAAAVGGGTTVLDSRTPDGHTVTVLPDGYRIAVLTEEPLVPPRPVYLRLGRREIRGRLHLPSWHSPGSGKLPVLLSPYGGPSQQVVTMERSWHTAVCQWFAEHGYAVLVADGRGTPGRGVRWIEAVAGDRLTAVLDDQVDALHDAASRYSDLDVGRVGIRGWSYSGYLAAGAVLRRPDVFHAAVAGAPPTDRRLYNAPWEERFLGHPALRADDYARCSLLPLASSLSRPLLLVHGLADTNVFPVHTLRLSAALLDAGRPHEVLLLPGEGHRVSPSVADKLLRAELSFLNRVLLSVG